MPVREEAFYGVLEAFGKRKIGWMETAISRIVAGEAADHHR